MSSAVDGDCWVYKWGANDGDNAAKEKGDGKDEKTIGRRLWSPQAEICPSGGVRGRMWSFADFDIGRKLGEGRFGKIYLARERRTKCAVVLKCLSKDMIRYHNLTHQLQREVELQEYAGRCNEHILRLFAYFWDDVRVVLVLEYADGGNLQTLLDSTPHHRLSEEEGRCILESLLLALHFLHERNILHRDVKPENILIAKKKVKLADFSWAVRLNRMDPRYSRRHTLCGTLDYLAPEQVSKRGCTTKADMWSVGVLAYRMLCGSLPFEHLSAWEVCSRIAQGDVRYPPHLSKEARHFMEALLCVDESQRLSSYEAMQHAFIRGLDCSSHASFRDMELPSALSSDSESNSVCWGTQLTHPPVLGGLEGETVPENVGERSQHTYQWQPTRGNNDVPCKGLANVPSSATHSCASFVTVSPSHSADCTPSVGDPGTPTLHFAPRDEWAPCVRAVATGATWKTCSENAAASSQGASYSRPRPHHSTSEKSSGMTTMHDYLRLGSFSPLSPVIVCHGVDSTSVDANPEEREKDCALRLCFEESPVSPSQLTAVSASTVGVNENV